MGKMKRLIRLFKAGIHGVLDRLEDKDLLLRQYLRDMQAALGQKEMDLKKMRLFRQRAIDRCATYQLESQKLEQDLIVAIGKGKEDIARMLIAKHRPAVMLKEEIGHRISYLEAEISAFRESIEHQKLQYEALKHRIAEYFYHKKRKELRLSSASFSLLEDSESARTAEIDLELFRRNHLL